MVAHTMQRRERCTEHGNAHCWDVGIVWRLEHPAVVIEHALREESIDREVDLQGMIGRG